MCQARLWRAALRHLSPKVLIDEAPGDVLLFRMRSGSVAKHLGVAAEVGAQASAEKWQAEVSQSKRGL